MIVMAEAPEWLTYKEAAARFGVSIWTVGDWVRSGIIRKHKRPLDRRAYVDAREIERVKSAPPRPERDDHED